MTKLVEWSTPSEKDIAVYYDYLLKNGFIKKPKPLENVVQLYCNKCYDTVHSRWSGDYVSCKCGAIGVDQTHHYTRIIGNEGDYLVVNNEDNDNAKTL
jgi:hypothetical protein